MIADSLLVYVTIRAIDQASSVLRMLGISGGGAFAALGIAAAAVVGGIAAVGAVSIKAATEFDQSMQKIAALTDTSAAQMQDYKNKLLSMAPALDQTPTALAQGLYFVISAGYKGADALNILSLSAKAAASTMTPMQNVADLLTTAMNAYRGSNVSAGQAMDDLMNTVVQGKVTMSSLATSMGFTLVTAKNAGLSLDQASAAVSTLSQVAGEHGARRVMMELNNSMRMVGIETEQVSAKAAKMKGLAAPWNAAAFAQMNYIQKLQYIAQETGGVGYLDKTQAAAYMATGNMSNLAQATAHANANFLSLVGGAAAFIPAAMLLSDKGKMYNQILGTMGTNGTKTAAAFDTMRQSTAQQVKMFETALTTIATVIGEQLLPAVNAIVSGFYRVGQSTLAFLQSSGGMQAFKYALLGIALVATTILLPALISVAIASAPVWGPIALAMLAIVGAGLLVGHALQAVSAHFGGMAGVMRALHPLITLVQGAFTRAGAELRHAFADPALQSALRQLQQALPQLLPLLQVIGFIIGAVLVVAFQFFVAALHGLIAALPGVITLFTGLVSILGGIGRVIKDVFTGNWKDLGPAFAQIAHGLGLVFRGLLMTVVGAAYGFFEHFVQLFGSSDAKIKAALLRVGAGVKATVGGWFSGLGTAVHNGITAVGQKFSELGTHAHNTLMAGGQLIVDAIEWPWKQGARLGQWLYQHNYYVQRFVDNTRAGFARARAWVLSTFNQVRADVRAALTWLESQGRAGWEAFSNTIIAPVTRMALWLYVRFVWARMQVIAELLKLKAEAQQRWNAFVGLVENLKQRIETAIQRSVVDPITQPVQKALASARGWGQQLIQMIARGIEDKASDIENAAKKALGAVAGWLGFHSPAPNVPESAQWGANLVTMLADSMLTRQALLSANAQRLAQTLGAAFGAPGSALYAGGGSANPNAATGLLGGAAGAGTGSGLADVARRGALLSGGGGSGGSATFNVTFPGVRNKDEIKQALTELQQQDYRRGRRAGSYGGLRAGIDTLT